MPILYAPFNEQTHDQIIDCSVSSYQDITDINVLQFTNTIQNYYMAQINDAR